MNAFEVGKKYFSTSACDHACVFTIEVIKRTAQTVTFRQNGRERRAKIRTDHNGEYIIPDRYAMSPVFRACREYSATLVAQETGRLPAVPVPLGKIIPFPLPV